MRGEWWCALPTQRHSTGDPIAWALRAALWCSGRSALRASATQKGRPRCATGSAGVDGMRYESGTVGGEIGIGKCE